tara:strand:- start:16 stop:243 length:228 start_codon:yes stop_codon:yes gene_type:complete
MKDHEWAEGLKASLRELVKQTGELETAERAGLTIIEIRAALAPGTNPYVVTIGAIARALGVRIRAEITSDAQARR